jgi:cytosine/adenosine deaminase-related metal-dependent hydrolase
MTAPAETSKSAVLEDARELCEQSGTPPVKAVRDVRRRAAASPDMDQLASVLMELEQTIEDGEGAIEDRLEALEDAIRVPRRLRLTMAPHEPFQAQRHSVLKRCLEEVNGRVIRRDDPEVVVEVPDEAAEWRIKSLYHWSCESIDD